MNTYTPETFLSASPQENLDFINYCARRGWVSFPFGAWRIWARDFVKRCIKKGWVKPPNPQQRGVPAGAVLAHPERICKGRYIRHKWGYADLCERCGAQFVGKKHAPSKRSFTPALPSLGGEGGRS